MLAVARVCVFSCDDQEKVLWKWRQVSKTAHASVARAVRETLEPRFQALEGALVSWKDMPLKTPFPFPVPRGPLPLTYVELTDGRKGARPPNAREGETRWFRPLFVWAISFVLFPATTPTDRVDIAKALGDAGDPRGCEPAYDYFLCMQWVEMGIVVEKEKDKEKDAKKWKKYPIHTKWKHAPEHSPQALLSTFSTGSYCYGMNMAEPGNRQRFTRALLEQIKGTVPALAFLLLWMQHVTFQTCVTDETFLSAVQGLTLDLIYKWRGLSMHNAPDYYCRCPFYLWFGDRPDTLIYDPNALHSPLMLTRDRAKRAEAKREVISKFADPVHREKLIGKANRHFDTEVSAGVRYLVHHGHFVKTE
jgi:hypothetical protein